MNDDIDIYVSRSLKNWAAKNSPPIDGRVKLLRNIKYPPPPEAGWFSRLWGGFKSSLQVSQNIVIFHDSWYCDPVPQSQNWVAHFAASWRLSH